MYKETEKRTYVYAVGEIGSGIGFTAQIPDDRVGRTGSRCANCGTETAYCEQFCKHCKFPFIGPYGFPQYEKWKTMPESRQNSYILSVFNSAYRGRLEYASGYYVPLTRDELYAVERLGEKSAMFFEITIGFHAKEIREILLI